MRIFKNFDTNGDQHALTEMGLLLKKHPIFLTSTIPFFLVLFLSFWGIWALSWGVAESIARYLMIPFLIVFFVLFWSMGAYILSYRRNFRQLYTRAELPLLLDNDHHFDRFIKFQFIGLAANGLLSAANIVLTVSEFLGHFSLTDWKIAAANAAAIVLNAAMIFCEVQILRLFIELEMDFVAINAERVSATDQTGFLSKKTSSVNTEKIRNIVVHSSGIFQSLIGYGSIQIFTEGLDETESLSMLKFVKNPSFVKKVMVDLFAAKSGPNA